MFETALAIPFWTYVAYVAAVVVLLATPGPNMMFCVACGMKGGARAGIAAGAGAAAGMVIQTALVAVGVASLVMASPVAFDVLRYGGAAYLLWLAWESWNAGDDLERRLGRRESLRAFFRGLVTNLTNPKVILFMVALLPQFADPGAAYPVWLQIIILGSIANLIFSIAEATCVVFADRLAGLLRKSRSAGRWMRKAAGSVLIALGANLLISER